MFFTQNPIGSSANEDLQDNAISFDYAMNSPAALWQDRFGKQHKTVQQALKDVGFKPAGFDFVSGGTLGIGDRDKCVFYPTDGYWYSWNGKLPYVVPANSSPTPGGKKGWGVVTRDERVIAREALRRTYADAGLNLVAGSFEQGGALVNSNDVLLQESTGKAFSGPAGTYLAGTSTTGFTDLSFFAGFITSLTIASWRLPVGSTVYLLDRDANFTIKTGTANGFNKIDAGDGNIAELIITDGRIICSQWGITSGENPVYAPTNSQCFAAIQDYINTLNPTKSFDIAVSGVVVVDNGITLNGGGRYGERYLSLSGVGGGAVISKIGTANTNANDSVIYLKQPPTPNAFACCNVKISNVKLTSATTSFGISSQDPVTFLNCKDVDINLTKTGATGYYFTQNVYINNFDGGILSCVGSAFRMLASGTTNSWTNLFASGCKSVAFQISSLYSTIGCLAADDCEDVAYKFSFADVDIGSLGCESPNIKSVLLASNGASITVGQIYLQGHGSGSTVNFDVVVSDSEAVVEVGCVATYHPSGNQVIPVARLAAAYSSKSSIKIKTVKGNYRFERENSCVAGATIELSGESGGTIATRENGIAFAGSGRYRNPFHYNSVMNIPSKTIFLNHGPNSTTLSDGRDVKWNGQGLLKGDIILLNNAGASGEAGLVVDVPGADFNSTTYKSIPVEIVVNALSDLPSTSLRVGRKVTVIAIKKTLTRFPDGWYDESGTKVV